MALNKDYYFHVRTFARLKLLKILSVLLRRYIIKGQHTNMPFKKITNQAPAEQEKYQYNKIAIYQDKIINNKIRFVTLFNHYTFCTLFEHYILIIHCCFNAYFLHLIK